MSPEDLKGPIDWVNISGFHSQLTGVLAGFAFAALTMLISNPPEGKQARDISDPLYTLLVVFFCLIISSFLYALATGDNTKGGPAFANMFASTVFSIASVQLFSCLAWFFREYRLAPAVIHGAHVLCEGAILIGAVMMGTTIGNWTDSVLGPGRAYQQEAATLIWFLPLLILPLVGGLQRRWRQQHGRELLDSAALRKLMLWELRFVIFVAVYCGLVLQSGPEKRPFLFPENMKVILAFAVAIFLYFAQLALPPTGLERESAD